MSIDTFMAWWNRLAQRNGKVKFRSRREAAEFVRSLANERGPNAKIIEMRREYEAIRQKRERGPAARSEHGERRALS